MSQFFQPGLTGPQPPQQYQEVMRVLNEFCAEVESATNGKVSCATNPGFVTNLGQQWNVTAHSKAKDISHILFRAYVPPTGLPTRLDFYEEQMTECPSADDVKIALKQYAGNAVIIQTLQSLAS